MSAAALLAEVEHHGGRLILEGERLKVTAPAPLPGELMDRLRQYKPELLRLLADPATHPSRPKSPEIAPESPAENGSTTRVFAQSPRSPGLAEKNAVGDAPCPTCGSGSFWLDQGGAWHCERCTPPGAEPVRTWRNFSGAKAPPAPSRPTEPWPTGLNAMLNRVATAFEWSDADRRDFVAWARRSPEGPADARAFLETENEKLPNPGLIDRHGVVLDMLDADQALRAAWTCADDGGDPVVLTLAIRGKGTCELAIPRERFDALRLPLLIDRLTSVQDGTA